MKTRFLLVCVLVAAGVALILSGVYAATQVPDTITMNSTVYDKHTKPLVTFAHKKHSGDYGIACADCHHLYKDGKNVWKEGDAVQRCEACHSKAKPLGGNSDEAKLSKAEKIKLYQYVAVHENCVGCHKELKGAGKPTGPVSCKQCHA